MPVGILHGSPLSCRRYIETFIGRYERQHGKPQGIPPDLDFHCGGQLHRSIATQRLRLCEGHRAGHERWGNFDHAVQSRKILTELREGCSPISGSDIAIPCSSAHGGDDFDPSDTGELEVMHGGGVKQGDHPA
jgi:hypothetical protein